MLQLTFCCTAIALSLRDAERQLSSKTQSLYPGISGSAITSNVSMHRESRKVGHPLANVIYFVVSNFKLNLFPISGIDLFSCLFIF